MPKDSKKIRSSDDAKATPLPSALAAIHAFGRSDDVQRQIGASATLVKSLSESGQQDWIEQAAGIIRSYERWHLLRVLWVSLEVPARLTDIEDVLTQAGTDLMNALESIARIAPTKESTDTLVRFCRNEHEYYWEQLETFFAGSPGIMRVEDRALRILHHFTQSADGIQSIKGMSLRAWAAALGVSPSTISRSRRWKRFKEAVQRFNQ